MKESLSVTLVQFDIEWENTQANLEFLNDQLTNLEADLIVLPEMFSTGFSMNPSRIAELPFGETYQWMKAKSIELNCAISGSVSTKENNKFYNRHYFVTPEKDFVYDKKHLFGYGKETEVYNAGNEIINAEYLDWKFRLITCYDLRFPVWCRNTDQYDVLICVANWPAVRVESWKSLLKARAIENMAYVIGVNRVGTDGYNLVYNGNSKIFDVLGNELTLNSTNKYIHQTIISKDELTQNRTKYRFLEDLDTFKLM